MSKFQQHHSFRTDPGKVLRAAQQLRFEPEEKRFEKCQVDCDELKHGVIALQNSLVILSKGVMFTLLSIKER